MEILFVRRWLVGISWWLQNKLCVKHHKYIFPLKYKYKTLIQDLKNINLVDINKFILDL